MASNPYIFNQLCQYLDRDYFEHLVNVYKSNRHVKSFSCWQHLKTMVWAQLTSRKSLRDIELSLKAHSGKLYQLGFGKSVARTTLAEANEKRNVAVYRELAQRMMERIRGIGIRRPDLQKMLECWSILGLFAVDSSTVHLDLRQFPWSVPQRNGGGIKIHTMFDILRQIPVLCLVTGNEERDQTFMSDYTYNQGHMYVFDKAYVKLPALHAIDRIGAWFVVRRKRHMTYETLSMKTDNEPRCVMADRMIKFKSRVARTSYPETLRLVQYYSEEKEVVMDFMTNNMTVPPEYIALAYKYRWDIELFFKWIKQHLHVEKFYGTSSNAVSIQVYTAVITYCIIAMVADDYCKDVGLYDVARYLSTGLTEKEHLKTFLRNIKAWTDKENQQPEMPSLFD